MNIGKCIGLFVLIAVILLGLCASIIALVDPFYQYHRPFLGARAVLDDRDNQMPGSIRHFSYDSVLVGNSLVENCNTDQLCAYDGGKYLKIIKSSGTMPDLLYYMDMAREKHTLKKVYWCMDLSQLDCELQGSVNKELPNWYLHTRTILDDATYLFNKEILLETIPKMLANAYLGKNVGGMAYDWREGKDFSSTKAMQAYDRTGNVIPENASALDLSDFEINLGRLKDEVTSHPETEYVFFLPPVSMNWWDIAYCNGLLNRQYVILEKIFEELLELSNVSLFDFQFEEEIVCNLDNYMDLVHYAPWVNQWMLEEMTRVEESAYQVELDGDILSPEEAILRTKQMAEYIEAEGIYKYY